MAKKAAAKKSEDSAPKTGAAVAAPPADYVVMARRFRPGTFADVVGQAPTTNALKQALRTGRVTASSLDLQNAGGIVSGRRLSLSVGVSEQGVPLSPDTLLLPSAATTLRLRAGNPDLTFRALALIGQAHSIATAPRGRLPRQSGRCGSSRCWTARRAS